MLITEYTSYHEDEIFALYSSVGWTAYTSDMGTLKQGFKKSLLVLAAYEGGKLLGIIRVVGERIQSRAFFFIAKKTYSSMY